MRRCFPFVTRFGSNARSASGFRSIANPAFAFLLGLSFPCFLLGLPDIAQAAIKFDITPHAVTLISAKNPKWDTVVVESYVYITGDAAYRNTGNTPKLYLEVRIDSLSAAKHYLKPGDSLETLSGFMVKDTVTVLKTPFAVVTWSDPLASFQKESTVENMRVSSMYFELHPRVDTVRVAGCPTMPAGLEGSGGFRSGYGSVAIAPALPVAAVIYNLLGRPVWSGRALPGEIPKNRLSAGTYLFAQGSAVLLFRVDPR